MRRTLLAAAIALLIAVACDSSSLIPSPDGNGYVHWRQDNPATLERHIKVLVPVELGSNATFLRGLDAGIQQANRSPYLAMVLDVGGRCEAHCITVARRDLPYPVIESTTWGWDSHGHMYGHAATMTIDIGVTTLDLMTRVSCHGLLHAAGLRHGGDHNHDGAPDTEGPCQRGIATSTDLDNIALSTGHRDTIPTTAAGVEGPPMRTKMSHTRAQIEAE